MAEKIGLEAVLSLASFSAAVSKYNSSLSGMGKQTTSIASSIGSSFAGIGGAALKMSGLVAGIGFAALATGLGAVVTTGLSFNNTMEQASAKINAFTKDADLTAQILEDVRKEAALTPFEFDAMANAVSGLLPAARQADVGIMDLLRDAEVLAASNPAEGLEGAAFALREAVSGDFTSVIERFNLPRSMINDLKAEGLPALEIVRTAMKNMGYDMDLVSALANTAEGRWSTLKDTFTNLAGTITKPIFDTLSSSLGGINDLLTANAPQMQAFADLLAGTVAEGITIISAKAKELSAAFASGGAAGLVGALGITPDAIALIEKFRGMITQIADTIAGPFMTAFSDLSAGGILDSINQGITFLNDHFAELQGALFGIGAVLATGVFAALVAGVLSLLTPFTLLTGAVILFSTAWAGNWGGIQEIAATTFATITELFNQFMLTWNTNWPIIQAVALTAWEIIQGIMAGFQTALGPVIAQLTIQFTQIGASLAGMGINWQTTWDAIVTATGIVAAAIGAAILLIIGVVAGVATGIAGGISAAITLFQSLATTATEVFTSLTTIFTGWITTISALLSGDFAGAWDGFKTVLQGTVTLVTSIFTGMLSAVTGVLGVMTGTIGGFVDGIVGFFQGMYDSLIGHSIIPDLVNGIVKWFKDLPQKILSSLGDLTTKVVAPFQKLGTTIKDELGEALTWLTNDALPLLNKGLDFVIQAIKDVIGYFNSLKDTVSSFSLPDILTPGSPPPFANALTDIATSAGAASDAIAGMQRSLITSKSASLDFIDDLDMGGLARGFGTGGGQWRNFRNILKNEIMGGMGALADGTADVMDSVYKVAARFNFPPQMAAEFAKANGLVEHLTGNFEKFRQQMNLENIGSMLGMGGSFSGIAGTLADMLQEQMGSAEDATKALDALKDSGTKLDKSNLSLTDTLEDQQSKLTILQAELTELTGQEELDTIAIDKKKLAIEQLTEAMEENRQKIVDNRQALIANQQALLDMQMDLATGNQGDQIAFLQDFLDSGEDSIRLIGEELGGIFAGQGLTSDVYWTRVAAQEELTRLLEEQRRQEELITQQKEAQGKLDKLKAQLDLINLGRQLGGDIFAGITFGLDASIEDLLAATNAVTMAMVDQINHDLQIHSPSGVMIKTFEQVMAGAALGVRRGESMLSDAVRSIPILNGSMPQFSQAAGISNSSTYNYNFPMTVNTAATAQGVVRQYDVRRSLANV